MTVSEALEQSKSFTMMHKGSITDTQRLILPAEDIIYAVVANIAKMPVHGELATTLSISDVISGVLTVTDQRILFVNSVLGRGVTKEIRLSDIRSIDSKGGDLYECLRIAGTTDMLVTSNASSLIAQLKNAINEALAQKKTQSHPVIISDDDTLDSSDVEQLTMLKKLYDSGVITAEEFSAKKAKILNL